MKSKITLFDVICSIAPMKLKVIKLIDHLVGGLLAYFMPTAQQRSIKGGPKNILIIRPGGIGDAVFMLPIIHALHRQGIEVDVLCERRNAQVFISQQQSLRRVYCYDCFKQFSAAFKNRYDVVVDAEQWHYLSALVAFIMPGQFKVGFNTRPLRGKLFNSRVEYGHNDYELDNFLRLFNGILDPDHGIKTIEGSFNVGDQLLDWAKGLMPDPGVALFLGGSIFLRRINEAQALEVLKQSFAKGYQVLLLGGEDAVSVGKCLMVKVKDQRLHNFINQITLEQTAALIKISKVFIGTDSGMLHVAVAVGTATVGVFGPGNIRKWGPKGDRNTRISKYLTCSPCTVFGYTVPTCQGRFDCLFKTGFDQRVLK